MKLLQNIFKPKADKIFTRHRFQHLGFGALLTLGFAKLAVICNTTAYTGAVLGIMACTIYGFLWELATPWMAKIFRWTFPYGDMVDFIAYILGSIGMAIFVAIIGRGA